MDQELTEQKVAEAIAFMESDAFNAFRKVIASKEKTQNLPNLVDDLELPSNHGNYTLPSPFHDNIYPNSPFPCSIIGSFNDAIEPQATPSPTLTPPSSSTSLLNTYLEAQPSPPTPTTIYPHPTHSPTPLFISKKKKPTKTPPSYWHTITTTLLSTNDSIIEPQPSPPTPIYTHPPTPLFIAKKNPPRSQ